MTSLLGKIDWGIPVLVGGFSGALVFHKMSSLFAEVLLAVRTGPPSAVALLEAKMDGTGLDLASGYCGSVDSGPSRTILENLRGGLGTLFVGRGYDYSPHGSTTSGVSTGSQDDQDWQQLSFG